jgi:hypothetical protein
MFRAPKPKDSKAWRDSYYHKLFGYKAADAAEQVLKYFEEERPNDKRPRKAVEAIREWAEDMRVLGMREVRKLSLDAHAAARDVKSDVAKYAAHAAGQAVGTWHVPTHALGAFAYAGRAFVAGKTRALRSPASMRGTTAKKVRGRSARHSR